MVDKEKIRLKIQYIEGNNAKLEQLRRLTLEEFVKDFRNIEAAKHLLQVNIEAMIDIANHVIARYRWETPATSGDSFKILWQKGYLNDKELEVFSQMVKFRNRVVHLYHTVDDEEIYRILQKHISDFSLFIKAISNQLF
ncbi:MAG: DUF86 domain-containing protein [Clostridia bacterium]|nr:DUF86 domain-containing protein [Clostridia bacterium]